MNNAVQKVPEARESIANKLIALGDEVATEAANLQDRSYNRLSSVCRSEPETKDRCGESVEEWPPLFNTLRSLLLSIKESIKETDRTLERLEL